MAQSVVDVCNSALQHVGAGIITSLDDDSPEARECSRAFDSNRRSELRKRPWRFAIKRVQLAPDADDPDFDFNNQFTIPADCIRVLRPAENQLDWQIEGRKILTNDGTTLNLRYLADIDDVTQWDPAFYDVFALSLALDIVERLTQSNQKKKALNEAYDEAVADAARANAFETGFQDPAEDDWILARL